MSFYIRKSIRFGPIRFNLSKSGIGVSSGVKGARISTGPRGTYINMGSKGVFYRQKIGGFGNSSYHSHFRDQASSESPNKAMGSPDESESKNVVNTTESELISQINARIQQPSFTWAVSLASITLSLSVAIAGFALQNNIVLPRGVPLSFFTNFFAILIFILGLWVTWVTKQQENHERISILQYELDNEAKDKFIAVQKAMESIAQAAFIWRVLFESSTWDWKRNAGATSLLTRSRILAGHMQPPFIQTKLKIFGFSLDFAKLFFLPDQILIYQNGKYGAISYNSFQVSMEQVRFIEEGNVPSDSQVVDYTWKYQRKDGGPDLRFSNNRKLPILLYGCIELLSPNNLNLQFAMALSNYAKYKQGWHSSSSTGSSKKFHQEKAKPNAPQSPDEDNPYIVLGIPSNATFDEIVSAYKKMALLYHPDRVESLAPEYKYIAEKRMKVINAAYAKLKQQFGRK